jgi:hypothetical protein
MTFCEFVLIHLETKANPSPSVRAQTFTDAFIARTCCLVLYLDIRKSAEGFIFQPHLVLPVTTLAIIWYCILY